MELHWYIWIPISMNIKTICMNNVYSRKSYVYWYSLWQNKFILLTKPKSKENWNPGFFEKLWEVLPIASLVKNLHSIKGQRAWVTHTVGIRQWMMTPKANSHNINICGKWKYFINNTVIDLLQSGWHGFAAADIQGSTVAFWYRSWSTNKPCHSGGCLLYSSCRNESWLGLNLHDSWLSATRGEQENVYWTWL